MFVQVWLGGAMSRCVEMMLQATHSDSDSNSNSNTVSTFLRLRMIEKALLYKATHPDSDPNSNLNSKTVSTNPALEVFRIRMAKGCIEIIILGGLSVFDRLLMSTTDFRRILMLCNVSLWCDVCIGGAIGSRQVAGAGTPHLTRRLSHTMVGRTPPFPTQAFAPKLS